MAQEVERAGRPGRQAKRPRPHNTSDGRKDFIPMHAFSEIYPANSNPPGP